MFSACGPSDPNADIADIQLELDFERTDLRLIAASGRIHAGESYMEAYKQELKGDSAFLFSYAGLDLINEELDRRGENPMPKYVIDSVLAFKLGPFLGDSAFLELIDTLGRAFPADAAFLAEQVEPLFKRYHLHFPEVYIPRIRTHINGYDPSGHPQSVDQLLITDQYLSLGLHYFMGSTFPYYSPNLPNYIRRRFDQDYMGVVIAQQLAEGTVQPLNPRQQPSLLDKMIREGIKLHMMSELLPNLPDSMIIMYSQEEINWANSFERDIYKDLTPKFFSTNFMDHRSYLAERPFTQEVSQVSAPRLGQYTGWRIVQAFMKKNTDLSLMGLCQMSDYEKIFRESKYKP